MEIGLHSLEVNNQIAMMARFSHAGNLTGLENILFVYKISLELFI